MIIIFALCFVINCAKPKSEWLKWQESLDLAYPNELSFKIDMRKKVFSEGEPLVFRLLISNKLSKPRTIVHTGKRASAIEGGFLTFKAVSELDSVLFYSPYVHANIGMSPNDAIMLKPHDTLYFYAILCPDLFRQYIYPRARTALQPGEYILESNIHLGTKFYPKPGRGLHITSNPTMFSIESLPTEERNHLSKIRPYMKNLFGHVEQCLFDERYLPEEFVDSALFWLDKIRNTNSCFAPYADFVHTCIPAVTRTHSDTIKLNRSISEARRFIAEYNGSILAEEMEFKLAWWLFLKDSTSMDFSEHARKTIEKYPQNFNSFGIRKHLSSGL